MDANGRESKRTKFGFGVEAESVTPCIRQAGELIRSGHDHHEPGGCTSNRRFGTGPTLISFSAIRVSQFTIVMLFAPAFAEQANFPSGLNVNQFCLTHGRPPFAFSHALGP